MAGYLGRGIDQIDNISTLDNLSFNGSDATFNLTQNSVAFVPVSADALQIQIDGVIQSGNYTVSGSTVTFDFTPSGSSVCNGIKHFGVGLLTQPSDGSVNMAQLGASGTKSSSTFLAGDNSFKTISGTTINNNADNRVITGSGTANTLEGEANLTYSSPNLTVTGGNPSIIHNNTTGGGDSGIKFQGSGTDYGFVNLDNSDGALDLGTSVGWSTRFYTNNAEKMRLDSSGNLLHAKTSANSNNVGIELRPAGELTITRTNNQLLDINRTDNDGTLVVFRQANQTEGTISVSGGTVSYNSFAGSHWSRLADNSKPTILRGTVMESISTLMDWYQVEYTKDEETLTEYIGALPDGKSVGDSHTVTVDGVEYTGTISKEDNERLPKCKISDTEDSKAVYGVFMDWDNDDDNVNDMYVTSLGAFVVRIHGDETVAIGDYLQSKGDGTAKVQADDILRASTIAKVTSTEKTHTYDDGSYCVPCTLHCG
jgi:hypothetical protein